MAYECVLVLGAAVGTCLSSDLSSIWNVLLKRSGNSLAENSEKVSFHTYLIVREDALTLYGFTEILDRDFF